MGGNSQMSEWPEVVIGRLLRGGVLLSVAVVIAGMVMSFSHHPEYLTSRAALEQLTRQDAHFPATFGEVVSGIRSGNGEAVVMAGLLLLIATPVARVALSIVIFIIERDRVYVMITGAVLLILLVGFAIGVGG
jgi:uncharacterized membrane protein